jgi:PAS domain-containing protein
VGVVKDVVVGTGVDGRIVVQDPSERTIVNYRVPQSDAVLGGDTYRLIVRGPNATFVDLANFANCIKLFNANLSLYVTADATVTLEVLVNGTPVYFGTGRTFDVFAPIPSKLLGRVNMYNVTLSFNFTSPFNATIWWLRVTGLGLFEDRVVDVLLIASDACIYFYDATCIGKAESLDPSYVLQAYTEFDGSAAIAYDSGSYALYMVNRSGLYAWDPGWALVTSECRSIGAGARIELVKGCIVVLPGSPANYVYVYDVALGNVVNKSLPSPYRLYQYTSSAIVDDSVMFTALDDGGRACLLMLNVTSMDVERLEFVPFYCVAGLAARGSMVYAVLCGLWSSATNMDNTKGIGVWVYDLGTNLSRVVLVANSSYVKLLGYSDRVEVYGGAQVLLAVDEDRVHVIGLKDVPLSKEVPVYAT